MAHPGSKRPGIVGNGPVDSFFTTSGGAMNQQQQQGDGAAEGYGSGAGGAGGKSSKARRHAGGRNSTPYARPAAGRHAAAGPSNAAALDSAKASAGQASSAGPNELARPLKNNSWWGALSSIASGAAHLVTTPLTFFKSDPRPEDTQQGEGSSFFWCKICAPALRQL